MAKSRRFMVGDVVLPVGGGYPDDAAVARKAPDADGFFYTLVGRRGLEFVDPESAGYYRRASQQEAGPDTLVIGKRRFWVDAASPGPLAYVQVGAQKVREFPDIEEADRAASETLSGDVPRDPSRWRREATDYRWMTFAGEYIIYVDNGGFWSLRLDHPKFGSGIIASWTNRGDADGPARMAAVARRDFLEERVPNADRY